VVGVSAALLAAACGGKAEAAAGPKSAYCDAARRWAVHEIVPFDDSDPAASKQYWGEYLAFVDQAVNLAPKKISGDWRINAAAQHDILTPLLEKYNFDMKLLDEKGTPEEKALFEEPPPEVKSAQHAVHGFESDVCGAQQPEPAEVSFQGEKPGPFCEVVAADNESSRALAQSGASPADVKAYYVDRDSRNLDEQQLSAAPAAIRDDVKAEIDWSAQRQRPVLVRYGFDVRKIILDGTKKDRADFQLTDKKVRDHFARVLAYEKQVCEQ